MGALLEALGIRRQNLTGFGIIIGDGVGIGGIGYGSASQLAGSGSFKRTFKKEGRPYPPPFGSSMIQLIRFLRHSAAHAASPAKLSMASPSHKPTCELSPVVGTSTNSSTSSVKMGLVAVP